MSIGRQDYSQRQEDRAERYERRAEAAEAESNAAYDQSHKIIGAIPMGQPILIGHHSEKRHRRDLDRADHLMQKCAEASEKASYYKNKAESARSNSAISSDDPEAVQKLQAKLEKLTASQATMKAVNAWYRKHKTLDGCPDLSPAVRQEIECSWSRGWYVGVPFPPYALSNNNAEISRIKKRLTQLRQIDEMEHIEIVFNGGIIQTNEDVNRVQIFFDEKPDEATRSKLKSNGFRWSPSECAWQTQRTPQAIRRAKHLLGIKG
jgi:hypothetical protein